MNVKVFHNLGFASMSRGYKPGDPQLLVFEFAIDCTPKDALEPIFEMLNIGETGIAADYRAKHLRSLSVGDVITFDDAESWAVGRYGWDQLDAPIVESTPNADRIGHATQTVPSESIDRLAGCRLVSVDRIELEPARTTDEAMSVMSVWYDLDAAQKVALVGLRVDERGNLFPL